MTIPYLGGLGEDIGPGLNSIADTVGQLINPDAKFQQQLRMTFLENPELMQKFVDIEKANPGTLKAFGFGEKGSDLLSKMQESIPGLHARLLAPKVAEELQTEGSKATRSAVSQAVSGQTPGQVEQDDFSSWFTKEGRKILEDNPELFARAARKKFGAGSELENTLEDETLQTINQRKSLREMAPREIVEQVAAGKLKLNEVSGLLVGPERLGVEMAMKLYQDEKEAQMRMFMSRFGQGDNSIARAKLAAAIDAWQAARGRGSLGGWYNHLWGDNTFGAPQAGDQEIISSALRDQQFEQRTKQLQTMFKTIEPLIATIKKGGAESEQLARITRINDVLRENNSEWEAFWDEEGIFNFGKLGFRNKAGDVTNDPSVITSAVPPASTFNGNERMAASLSPEQRALAQRLRGLTGTARASFVQRIRARAGNPQVAEAIITLGGGE